MENCKILLVLLPILMAISVVDGINIGINCGTSNGGHGMSYSSDMKIDKGVAADGHFLLYGGTQAGRCGYRGSGNLNAKDTLSNGADSVTLEARGQLLPGYSYDEPIKIIDANFVTGVQALTGTGSDIYCRAQANSRGDKFTSSVSAEIGKGSIVISQGATAQENDANAWQAISSAYGKEIGLPAEDIMLTAESSDKFGDFTNSIVTVDSGFLDDYNSQAGAAILLGKQGNKYIDVYALHGPFNIEDNVENPIGSIAGDTIKSAGLAITKKGLFASYSDTIIDGSIAGRFDSGVEVKRELLQVPSSKVWVIAAPLESPAAWEGFPGQIDIDASRISSYSCAGTYIPIRRWCGFGLPIIEEMDMSLARGVKVTNWVAGHVFASSSEAGEDPSI